MSKNNLEVEIYYGSRDFDEIMKKLVLRKINESIRDSEGKNTKDNQTTIHHKDSRRIIRLLKFTHIFATYSLK